jgi:hypothetical protein
VHVKKLFMIPAALAVGALALISGGGNALAAGPTNPSFETGDTSGWTEVLGEYGRINVEHGGGLPGTGTFSAAVYGGLEDVPTELRQTVNLAADETIGGLVRWQANDGCPFDDGASVSIDGPAAGSGDATQVFYASACTSGSVDWTWWSYTATVAGAHTIIAQSWNGGDSSFGSPLFLDDYLVFDGYARAWTFGDCWDGCNGFAVIAGDISGADDIRNAVLYALGDSDLYGPYITFGTAFKVGAQFTPPVFFDSGGDYDCSPAATTDPGRELVTADQVVNVGGVWLAWFQIGHPCEM